MNELTEAQLLADEAGAWVPMTGDERHVTLERLAKLIALARASAPTPPAVQGGEPCDCGPTCRDNGVGHCRYDSHRAPAAQATHDERVDCGECPSISAGCERGKCLHRSDTPAAQPMQAPAPSVEPFAVLHDDGYFTFRGPAPEGYDRAGWRMHVYAAPVAAQAPQPEPLHITHGPLMRYAATLLRLRKPVTPDFEQAAADLERAVDGQPTPSGEPSPEWLEVAAAVERDLFRGVAKMVTAQAPAVPEERQERGGTDA